VKRGGKTPLPLFFFASSSPSLFLLFLFPFSASFECKEFSFISTQLCRDWTVTIRASTKDSVKGMSTVGNGSQPLCKTEPMEGFVTLGVLTNFVWKFPSIPCSCYFSYKNQRSKKKMKERQRRKEQVRGGGIPSVSR
jgi:hypothetical protein